MDRTPLLKAAFLLSAAASFCRAQTNTETSSPPVHLSLDPLERIAAPVVDPASDAAERAIAHFKLPADLEAKLWAAEPMLADPVAMAFNEKGQLYVAETHRYRSSVLDIRGYMPMLEEDLASRTIEDRSKLIHRVFGEEGAKQFAIESELVRVVEDRAGRGVADHSEIFATGFNSELDGIGAGVLARKGKVWYTNIPSLWMLEADPSGTRAVKRTELLRGFGVHFNYTGHDFHGVIFGPDGKLYFTIGDRGTHVRSHEGKLIDLPDTGACFRCDPDGSNFEVVATGLRNPQEIAFDEHGNLFTGDNDCDNGDEERLVYIVEGGDSGWRIGYQHAPMGKAGPWMTDDLWKPRFPGDPAYLIPPICNIEDGPSGVAYYPGTGLTPDYAGNFFICHFKGSVTRSGVQTYKVKPSGAGFEIVDSKTFISGMLPTDVTFGPDGRLYVVDWVEGWPKSNKGRVYAIVPKIADPKETQLLAEMKQLFAEGMEKKNTAELLALLQHRDQRIRQEAQFELADRGAKSIAVFESVANDTTALTVTRLHALWGLGQIAAHDRTALRSFPKLLEAADPEVRAQVAKLVGDHHVESTYDALIKHLEDSAPRVAFFSAQSLGKFGRADASPALIALIRRNADADVYLRHAAVFALTQFGKTKTLDAAAKDSSASVRLAALLVYRRLGDAAVAQFLHETDPYLVREAALAINDANIIDAFPALADQLGSAPLSDSPLVLRSLNAHFRLGRPADAVALAEFSARSDAPDPLRAEALIQLGLWGAPPARDRLVGLYRPLPTRDGRAAADAVQAVLGKLLHDAPASVQLAALSTIKNLKVISSAEQVAALVADEKANAGARAQALQTLDQFGDEHLNAALRAAENSTAAELRLAALQIQARRAPAETLPLVKKLAEEGGPGEQRAAFSALAKLNSPQAGAELIAGLDRLQSGKIAPAAEAELLDAAQKSGTPAVKTRYLQLVKTWSDGSDPLAPFHSALAGGNATHGQFLFQQNLILACVRCHKVRGEGGDAGPDLTRIGAQKTPEYLLESVVKPNAKIADGFDLQSLVLTDGTVQSGLFVRDDPTEVVLKKPDGTEFKVARAQIKERHSAPSSMPEVFGQAFSRSELRDVLAYLQNLKAGRVTQNLPPRALANVKNIHAGAATDNGEAPAGL